MSQDFDRDALLPLLKKLNSNIDEEILKAAHALTAGMKASGKTWEDLIVHPGSESPNQDSDIDEPDDEIEEEEFEDQDDEAEETASASEKISDEESLKIIEKMLKKFKISAQMREELEGYKEDIADGEFADSDRQYLRSLHARLSALQ